MMGIRFKTKKEAKAAVPFGRERISRPAASDAPGESDLPSHSAPRVRTGRYLADPMNAAQVTNRAIDMYRAASPEQVEEGRKWYPRAIAEACRIALETDTPHRTVASVIAATSINQSRKGNMTLARRYCASRTPMGLPRVRDNLARIEAGEDISGRKIRDFAKALEGDIRAVVVDRWMFRAFGFKMGSKRKPYETVAQGIADAADILGVSPRALQATIWVIQRGRSE